MGEIKCYEDRRRIELVLYYPYGEMDEGRRYIRRITLYKKDMTLVVREVWDTPLEQHVTYYKSVKLTPYDYEEVANFLRSVKTPEDLLNLKPLLDKYLK